MPKNFTLEFGRFKLSQETVSARTQGQFSCGAFKCLWVAMTISSSSSQKGNDVVICFINCVCVCMFQDLNDSCVGIAMIQQIEQILKISIVSTYNRGICYPLSISYIISIPELCLQ